jgi:hypothetical protein
MAGTKYAAVPEKKIGSVDVPNFAAGLFLGGDQNGPVNCFVKSKDAELDKFGYLIPRRDLKPFLPDTVNTAYQKLPVLKNGEILYFTLDDGKAKWCRKGDTTWTDCTGDNTVTTNNGGLPKLLRTLDCILILNGKNGDKLAYIDLNTAGYDVVKYSLVADPTTAPTATRTNLGTGTGPFHIYYAYNYSGAVGQTKLSPILDVVIDNTRDMWQTLTSKGSIKISRPAGPAPAGAHFWNLYIALAPTAGTIQESDMLQLAVKLDLNSYDFVDNGTLDINLGSVAPEVNSTDGPKVNNGIIEDGNPILFDDQDNPYNIHIGGGGLNALSFSVSDGGYRAEPEKGTNYYPTTIIGFRTGQGQPALTILYSNTEGLAKQSVLQQQTVNYGGDQSFTVWGVTEQHYGAAGVAAANSAINMNGKLLFVSTNGIQSAETQPTIQNVMSIVPVSSPIDDLVNSIKNSAMPSIVGTGWDNKYMWLVPTAGFDTPQQILILDANNKGIEGKGAWYTLDIPAQWIGVVSPADDAAFVYICQGTKSYILQEGVATFDTKNGSSVPFSTGATGALIGMGGAAHNTWQADVQVMFYVMGLVGEMTIGVTYRNQNGKLKSKTRKINGPSFTPSGAGGYGDTGWSYGSGPALSSEPAITSGSASSSPVDVRKPVFIGEIHNEAQWFYSTPVGFNNYKVKAISFEGINLGVRPDLQ